EEWKDAFVLQTISKPEVKDANGANLTGYKNNLLNWTASWIAFEFSGTAVEVEISKVGGSAIKKAMVRPVGHASAAKIENGKAYITFDKPANVNVDIDGQMEDRYTGMGYSGPPVHTISLFANPVFKEPKLTNPKVYALNPGETIPADRSSWDTIYFKPGVHHIGTPFQISSGKVLYIPGNAVVHGTIHPPDTWGASASYNWSVYGSGALSGEEVARAPGEKWNKPFTYQANRVRLEGFVVVDPAHHTFNMNNNDENPAKVNVYKNLKILGWRINGDGLNAFRNSEITDCFFRCQDDHFYYGGDNVKISNCVCWSDYNGAVVYVTKGAKNMESSYFKDIRVIYHRAGWHYWEGGRVISFRDRKPGNTIKNVQIKNVLVEDPFPAFPPFYFKMSNPDNSSASIDYDNIIIENVVQEHPGVSGSGDNTYGKPGNTMLGLDEARKFKNITFKNCSYNNKWLGSFEDGNFLVNKYVENITFFLEHVKHQISLSVNNETGGSVSGDAIYSHGEKATVSATAKPNFRFVCWMENKDTVSVNPNYTFTVTQGRQINAVFSPLTSSPSGLKNSIHIYPNPASGKLYINSDGNSSKKMEMFDLSGKVVYAGRLVNQNETIDLNGFLSGLYFIRVYTPKDVFNTKVIVRRN
ncbi:MAG: T9SS type A sorting domain-containing protein, partial [Bacteroidetes bacterium]